MQNSMDGEWLAKKHGVSVLCWGGGKLFLKVRPINEKSFSRFDLEIRDHKEFGYLDHFDLSFDLYDEIDVKGLP